MPKAAAASAAPAAPKAAGDLLARCGGKERISPASVEALTSAETRRRTRLAAFSGQRPRPDRTRLGPTPAHPGLSVLAFGLFPPAGRDPTRPDQALADASPN